MIITKPRVSDFYIARPIAPQNDERILLFGLLILGCVCVAGVASLGILASKFEDYAPEEFKRPNFKFSQLDPASRPNYWLYSSVIAKNVNRQDLIDYVLTSNDGQSRCFQTRRKYEKAVGLALKMGINNHRILHKVRSLANNPRCALSLSSILKDSVGLFSYQSWILREMRGAIDTNDKALFQFLALEYGKDSCLSAYFWQNLMQNRQEDYLIYGGCNVARLIFLDSNRQERQILIDMLKRLSIYGSINYFKEFQSLERDYFRQPNMTFVLQ